MKRLVIYLLSSIKFKKRREQIKNQHFSDYLRSELSKFQHPRESLPVKDLERYEVKSLITDGRSFKHLHQ